MKIRTAKSFLFVGTCALTLAFATQLASASDPGSSDWPMWGGTADRNMVSNQKGMPTSWDVKTKKNVKWIATLGSQSYGNPVVPGGQIYVGTQQRGHCATQTRRDRGVLIASVNPDGEFLWQQTHEKLAAGALMTGRFRESALLRSWKATVSTTSRSLRGGMPRPQGFRDNENDETLER